MEIDGGKILAAWGGGVGGSDWDQREKAKDVKSIINGPEQHLKDCAEIFSSKTESLVRSLSYFSCGSTCTWWSLNAL